MEKILRVDRLKYLVESGQLRFVMIISNGQQPEIEDWVKKKRPRTANNALAGTATGRQHVQCATTETIVKNV